MLDFTATRSNLCVHQDASACTIRVMKQLPRKLRSFPLVRSTEHGSSSLRSSNMQTKNCKNVYCTYMFTENAGSDRFEAWKNDLYRWPRELGSASLGFVKPILCRFTTRRPMKFVQPLRRIGSDTGTLFSTNQPSRGVSTVS